MDIFIDRVYAQNFLPFADITHLSLIEEEHEILLCMGTVLCIESERLIQMKEALHIDSETIEWANESYLILSLARILALMGEHMKAI